MLTDPAIQSMDHMFGSTDLGIEGILKFLVTHQHTSLCEDLQWPLLPPRLPSLMAHLEQRRNTTYSENSGKECMELVALYEELVRKVFPDSGTPDVLTSAAGCQEGEELKNSTHIAGLPDKLGNDEHFGHHYGSGIVFCGRKFAPAGGCSCATCDGVCGPFNGCPCPECFTLLEQLWRSTAQDVSYISKCLNGHPLHLKTLHQLTTSGKLNGTFICDTCRISYSQKWMLLLYCELCDFEMCSLCVSLWFSSEAKFRLRGEKLQPHFGTGSGRYIIYCGRRFTDRRQCPCGNCDGVCNINGCACALCSAFLGYLFVKESATGGKCPAGHLLHRLQLFDLEKIKGYSSGENVSFKCDGCFCSFHARYTYVMHCGCCDYDLCPECVYKAIPEDKTQAFNT